MLTVVRCAFDKNFSSIEKIFSSTSNYYFAFINRSNYLSQILTTFAGYIST